MTPTQIPSPSDVNQNIFVSMEPGRSNIDQVITQHSDCFDFELTQVLTPTRRSEQLRKKMNGIQKQFKIGHKKKLTRNWIKEKRVKKAWKMVVLTMSLIMTFQNMHCSKLVA